MKSVLWLGGLALATVMTGRVAEPARSVKPYAPVPAQLFHRRDGLGNVFTRLKQGKEVRIAYFGGSITAQEGWRHKTLKWFRDRYPHAKITEINAAIGGTGSDLGVYRFQQDVLSHHPDLIFVEFAVNDGGAAPENIWRGMEGIVRQAWAENPTIDFCYVYTFARGQEAKLDQDFCPRAASSDEFLADHYGIPSINMAMRIAELARGGKLLFTPRKDRESKEVATPPDTILFSNDGVHPLDAGHEVYSNVIENSLVEMEGMKPKRHTLKSPFITDHWQQAKLVPLEAEMLSSGWKKLSPKEGLGANFSDRMPEIWEATQPGERISFRFKGTSAKLYDIIGPDGGQVVCTVDGKPSPPVPLFDSYCSYHRLASLTVGEGLADTVHTVTVEIQPEQPDRSSVTDVEKNQPGFDPKKYDGTVVRVGSLMILGELTRDK